MKKFDPRRTKFDLDWFIASICFVVVVISVLMEVV